MTLPTLKRSPTFPSPQKSECKRDSFVGGSLLGDGCLPRCPTLSHSTPPHCSGNGDQSGDGSGGNMTFSLLPSFLPSIFWAMSLSSLHGPSGNVALRTLEFSPTALNLARIMWFWLRGTNACVGRKHFIHSFYVVPVYKCYQCRIEATTIALQQSFINWLRVEIVGVLTSVAIKGFVIWWRVEAMRKSYVDFQQH